MSKHSKIGIKGEQIAADFLQKKGYNILFRNWRTGQKEVDIVAFKEGMVIFVEVKTRSGQFLGYPEESVNHKKQQNLRLAASAFLDAFPNYKNLRFDIVGILISGDVAKEIVHFEEAFH